MISKVNKTICTHNMFEYGDIIILGLSGGADSISLLYILNDLKTVYNIKIIAVHINHCIRGFESDSDEIFALEVCKQLGIKFVAFRHDIKEYSKNHGITDEEAGRKLRYESFYNVLSQEKANKIAVAHNKNDQAETILMRLVRGTGIKGLGGIPYVRNEIIRPLLDCTRTEIEEYCSKNSISYKTDSTNNLEVYTRNKIRLNLIPFIERELNTNIIETLCRTSHLLNEENSFLEKISNQAFLECTIIKDAVLIDINKLSKYDIIIKRRIIRLACVRYKEDLHDINYDHIQTVLNLIEKQNGKSVMLPNNILVTRQYDFLSISLYSGDTEAFCYDLEYNKFVFINEINMYATISRELIENKKNFTNMYTKTFSYDKINSVVQIRNRKKGDKIYLKGMTGNKKIKDLFIDLKIPKSQRDNIALVACGQSIIWILDDKNRTSVAYEADTYNNINTNTNNKIFIQLWGIAKNE